MFKTLCSKREGLGEFHLSWLDEGVHNALSVKQKNIE